MFKQAIEEGKKRWKESQAEFLLSRGETFSSLFLVKIYSYYFQKWVHNQSSFFCDKKHWDFLNYQEEVPSNT